MSVYMVVIRPKAEAKAKDKKLPFSVSIEVAGESREAAITTAFTYLAQPESWAVAEAFLFVGE